jgi:hypothetical protein
MPLKLGKPKMPSAAKPRKDTERDTRKAVVQGTASEFATMPSSTDRLNGRCWVSRGSRGQTLSAARPISLAYRSSSVTASEEVFVDCAGWFPRAYVAAADRIR